MARRWLTVASAALLLVMGGCGGGGGGGGDPQPVTEGTMAQAGVKSISRTAESMHVLPGGSVSTTMGLNLQDGAQATDLHWTIEGAATGSSVTVDGQYLTLRVAVPPDASDKVTVYLRATNTRLRRYARIPLDVTVNAVSQTTTTTVGKAGASISVGDQVFDIPPNDIAAPIQVKVLKADLPAQAEKYSIQFDRSIVGSGLKIKLPPLPGDSETATPKAIRPSSEGTRTKMAATPACSVEVNLSPYSTTNSNIFGTRAPNFQDKGLGTEIYYRMGRFMSGRFAGGRLRALENNEIIAEALVGAGNSIDFEIKAGASLDTVLRPTQNSTCSAAELVKNFDWSNAEPVLFVHGFALGDSLGGGLGTWQKFPALAQMTPTGSGRILVPFEFHWRTNADLKTVATDLGAAINLISNNSGRKVHIVSHSFGGVLSRVLLQKLAPDATTPSNASMADARLNVASLVTLGSPHSGILDRDNAVNLDEDNKVPAFVGEYHFPKGQDAASFEFCMQISCRQMGEAAAMYMLSAGDYFGYRKNDRVIGGMAAQLAASRNELPEIPIAVGIGLSVGGSSDALQVGNGDYLISFGGQRIVNSGTTSASASSALLNNAKIGAATVSEVLLGFEDQPTLRPGYSPDLSTVGALRRNGYLHSGATGAANFCTIDGGDITGVNCTLPAESRSIGVLSSYGIEAAPFNQCDAPITCTHAGYKIFRKMMSDKLNLNLKEALTPDRPSPIQLKVAADKVPAGAESRIQAILSEIQSNRWDSFGRVRWHDIPQARMVHFNAELESIYGATPESALIKQLYLAQSTAFDAFVSRSLQQQNSWFTFDKDTAIAFRKVLVNGVQAAYAAVQMAAPSATLSISEGSRVLNHGASLRAIKALEALNKASEFADILQDCSRVGAQALHAVIGDQLSRPLEQMESDKLLEAISSDVSCIVDLFGKIDKSSNSLKILAAVSQATVDYDGTTVSMWVAITDFFSGALEMFPPSSLREFLSGAVNLINNLADTISIATELQRHVDEVVSLRQDRVLAVVDRMRNALIDERLRLLVMTRANGLFVMGDPTIVAWPATAASASTLMAGATVRFDVVNGPAQATRVGWTFDGAAAATAIYTVIAEGIDYVVSATTGLVKTVTAYFSDAANNVISSITSVFLVDASTQPTIGSVEHGLVTTGTSAAFTLKGTNLPEGLVLTIQDCEGISEILLGGSTSQRQFNCTFPAGTAAGVKEGTISLPGATGSPFGVVLKTFEVTVSISGENPVSGMEWRDCAPSCTGEWKKTGNIIDGWYTLKGLGTLGWGQEIRIPLGGSYRLSGLEYEVLVRQDGPNSDLGFGFGNQVPTDADPYFTTKLLGNFEYVADYLNHLWRVKITDSGPSCTLNGTAISCMPSGVGIPIDSSNSNQSVSWFIIYERDAKAIQDITVWSNGTQILRKSFCCGTPTNFQVPANSYTGYPFTVPANVTTCRFTAPGTWYGSSKEDSLSDADGIGTPPSGHTANDLKAYSLIAKVGASYVLIGKSSTHTVVPGQIWYLKINDADSVDLFTDNRGSLAVSVSCS